MNLTKDGIPIDPTTGLEKPRRIATIAHVHHHSLSTALAMAMLSGMAAPSRDINIFNSEEPELYPLGHDLGKTDRRFFFPEPEFSHPSPRFKTPIVYSTVDRGKVKAARKQSRQNKRKRK